MSALVSCGCPGLCLCDLEADLAAARLGVTGPRLGYWECLGCGHKVYGPAGRMSCPKCGGALGYRTSRARPGDRACP